MGREPNPPAPSSCFGAGGRRPSLWWRPGAMGLWSKGAKFQLDLARDLCRRNVAPGVVIEHSGYRFDCPSMALPRPEKCRWPVIMLAHYSIAAAYFAPAGSQGSRPVRAAAHVGCHRYGPALRIRWSEL